MRRSLRCMIGRHKWRYLWKMVPVISGGMQQKLHRRCVRCSRLHEIGS